MIPVLAALLIAVAPIPAPVQSPAQAQVTEAPAAKAVVIIVDKLAFEDFTDFPEAVEPLRALAEQGAVAMMNVRTGGSADSANGHLSLALGRRAVAGRHAGLALSPAESYEGRPAGLAYSAIAGKEPGGGLLHLGTGELERAFEESDVLLGTALEDAGVSRAVIGNADVPGERRRLGALLAIDEDGQAPVGHVGDEVLVDDAQWPTRFRTDYETIVELVKGSLAEAEFVVVELGDLARLEEVEASLSPDRASALRRVALERISALVKAVLDSTAASASSGPTDVFVVSPSPSAALGRTVLPVTPVMYWSAPAPVAGLLTSGSTRRDGIVTNADFQPSVLERFGARTGVGAAGGRAWRVVPRGAPFSELLELYRSTREIHLQRLPVIQPYFFTVLGVTALGALITYGVYRGVFSWSSGADRLWRLLLTALASFPAALLILALFEPGTLGLTWLRLGGILVALAAAGFALGRGSSWGPVGALALITSLLLAWDILRGAPLMQRSLLGYDPVAGSRYYGIGNEYMGTLIGAALMGAAFVLERRRLGAEAAWRPAAYVAAMAVLMAHPRFGINVGGTIAAVAAAAAAFYFSRGRRFSTREALTWCVCLAGALAAIGLLDFLIWRDEASHLGRAVAMVASSGSDPLWDMFSRKVAVNWKLIRLTIWSRVALGSLALLGALVIWPNWLGRALSLHHPRLVALMRAALVGAVFALIANDSGVVAASTLLVWPVLAGLALAVRMARIYRVAAKAGIVPDSGPGGGVAGRSLDKPAERV